MPTTVATMALMMPTIQETIMPMMSVSLSEVNLSYYCDVGVVSRNFRTVKGNDMFSCPSQSSYNPLLKR